MLKGNSLIEFLSFQAISNGALNAESLPKRLKIMGWGKNETNDEPVYLDDDSMKVFESNQKKLGRERVPLDFDHCTVPGSENFSKGMPKSIAAYGDPKIIPGDGLYLENMEWTDMGKKFAKNYSDLSPAPVLKDKKVIGLHSAALTPAGAIDGLTFYSSNKDNTEMIRKLNSDDNNLTDDEHDKDDIGCVCPDCLDSDDHYSKYGNVEYADTKNHKYPIDTEKHVRAAWSYINMPKNAKKEDNLDKVKSNIQNAMKKFDIKESEPKAMSASTPDAYKNAMPIESITTRQHMIDTFKSLSPKLGMKSEAEILEILKTLVAKWEGEQAEDKDQITTKENSKVEQFSAEVKNLRDEINELKSKNVAEVAKREEVEKQDIVNQAGRDGKVIPLSADSIKLVSVSTLREMVNNLQVGKVPLKSTMRAYSAGENKKASLSDSIRLIEEQVANAKR